MLRVKGLFNLSHGIFRVSHADVTCVVTCVKFQNSCLISIRDCLTHYQTTTQQLK